jgi:hypothetical protein
MKKYILTGLIACSMLFTTACTPLERQAYNTIVAAKAFIDKEKSAHPECVASSTGAFCQSLTKATAAKDALIDAAEVYCSSPSFDTGGGSCTPPTKGQPGAQQAADKLKAAIAIYNQASKDIKGAL